MTSIGSGNIQSEFQFNSDPNNKNSSFIRFSELFDEAQAVDPDSFKRNPIDGVWIQDIKTSSSSQEVLGTQNKPNGRSDDTVFSDAHLDALNYYVKDGCFFVDKFNFEGVYNFPSGMGLVSQQSTS